MGFVENSDVGIKGQSLLITALLHWFLHFDADGDYRCGIDRGWERSEKMQPESQCLMMPWGPSSTPPKQKKWKVEILINSLHGSHQDDMINQCHVQRVTSSLAPSKIMGEFLVTETTFLHSSSSRGTKALMSKRIKHMRHYTKAILLYKTEHTQVDFDWL